MEWLRNTLDFILQTILAEIIVVIVGVLFAQVLYNRWVEWRYGRWRVVLRNDEGEILNRPISAGKVKEILNEESELAVFLKGVASPYEWINCDPLEEGRLNGLLNEDHEQRRFILNLDKNPPRKPRQANERVRDM